MGSVSLLVALNLIGLATHEAQQRSDINQQLSSLLNEICYHGELTEGDFLLNINDRVDFKVLIEPADLKSEDDSTINQIFRIKIIAKLKSEGKKVAEIERYVNREFWSANQ